MILDRPAASEAPRIIGFAPPVSTAKPAPILTAESDVEPKAASPLISASSYNPALKGETAQKPASALKGKPVEKAPSALKGTATPGEARKDRPPRIAGFEWFAQSRGFTCREVIGGGPDRQRKYIGFLSGKKWEAMKAAHKGESLRASLREWIEEKRSGLQ